MKKVVVAVLLTLALVGAVVAAPLELEGSLGTEIEYIPNEDLQGTTYLQLGYLSQLNKNANAVFGLRGQSVGGGTVNDWYRGYLIPLQRDLNNIGQNESFVVQLL